MRYYGALLFLPPILLLVGVGVGGGGQAGETVSSSESEGASTDSVPPFITVDAGVDAGPEIGAAEPTAAVTASVQPAAPTVSVTGHHLEVDAPLVWMAVCVNPGAALTWGLTAGLEVGGRAALTVRLRFPNAGLLPYLVEGEASDMRWGIGGGLGGRYYITGRGHPRGFFIGALLEYYQVSGRRPTYDWQLRYLGPELDAGYRWVSSHFMVSLGGNLGGLINVHVKRAYDFGWVDTGEMLPPVPVAELTVEIGWVGVVK